MHYDDSNSAVARAARIRRAHDMEATELGIMRRRAVRTRPRVLSGMVARLLRRTREAARRVEHGQPPVEIETLVER